MIRDMNLLRRMVLAIEDHPDGFAPNPLEIPGYTPEQIGYHSYLLVDAGLAEGADATGLEDTGPNYLISHLTSAGHEFASQCRSDTVWNKAWATVQGVTGTVTLEALRLALGRAVRSLMG